MANQRHAIVLFDGVCTLCDGFVGFVIDRDPTKRFVFSPLQSEQAHNLLSALGVQPSVLSGAPDSILLVEDNRVHLRSSAVLNVVGRLSFPWNMCALLLGIPATLRDMVYRVVARHRYRWFGQKDQCRIPNDDLRSRFLENRPDVLAAALVKVGHVPAN